MSLELAETLLRRAGGLLALSALAVAFYGIWRGTHHPFAQGRRHPPAR